MMMIKKLLTKGSKMREDSIGSKYSSSSTSGTNASSSFFFASSLSASRSVVTSTDRPKKNVSFAKTEPSIIIVATTSNENIIIDPQDLYYTSEELKRYHHREIASAARATRRGLPQPEESDTYTWRGMECYKYDAVETYWQRKKKREKHAFSVVTVWRGQRAFHDYDDEELRVYAEKHSRKDKKLAIARGISDAKELGYITTVQSKGGRIRQTLSGYASAAFSLKSSLRSEEVLQRTA